MFPPLTTSRPHTRSLRELVRGAADTDPQRRSFGELVRGAVDTALEFATLGEATAPGRTERQAPTGPAVPPRPERIAPTSEHPHRRQVGHAPRRGRPGTVAPRAQVCVTPVHRPARRGR
jgi:hypothetical protein